MTKKKFLILQRVCQKYRIPIFEQLYKKKDIEFKLIYGDDLPKTKTKTSGDLSKFESIKIRSIHFNLFGYTFTYPIGLIRLLFKIKPDVVLCEGESFFLGYLKTFLYRFFFNKKLGIMHWCYISLPGVIEKKWSIKYFVKSFFRDKFDACVLYSSYSLKSYIALGQKLEKGFVATNVGDTDKFLKKHEKIKETKEELRKTLKLPNIFTVLFVGNLSDQKKPFLLLDIFENLKDEEFNLVLIGSGLLEKSIKNEIKKRNIKNIQMLGHKSEDLVKYYVASDCLILPGLGGMVISEALASSLPVVMHKSDGVEYDLIINYKTGFRVKNANSKEFIKKIRYLKDNPDEREKMAYKCKKLIVEKFNTKNMVQKIIEAVDFSLQKRRGY